MKFRKRRIAWSVFWGLACVLLVVLWVRSYSSSQSAIWVSSGGHVFLFGSKLGDGTFIYEANPQVIDRIGAGWTFMNEEVSPQLKKEEQRWITGRFRFGSGIANRTRITAPFWLLASSCGVAGAATCFPFIRWQFTLRTLLIATTLVAVVL